MNKWKDLLKKKESVLILILVGLIFLVIGIPTNNKGDTAQKKEEPIEVNTATDTAGDLEQRLEEILGEIEGVGKVQVMITFMDRGESVVEKDVTGAEESGEHGSSSTTSEESTYYQNNDETYPYVVNVYQPKILGVLVVAQGANDPLVQSKIMEGVMALFGIESHKISIINMQ